MKLQNRIGIILKLKDYLSADTSDWQAVKYQAFMSNGWFTPAFINLAVNNLLEGFLEEDKLNRWLSCYPIADGLSPKNVGIVMAGNIPIVGFHDFLSVFMSGHFQTIKFSSKDDVLLKHLIDKMYEWAPEMHLYVNIAPMLKGCDAYIATGSNNSARYFDYYFSRYPSIIRKNRTSVGLLTGNETTSDLEKLSDDIHIFFGLGCRNVTKIFVPQGYDFVPLLQSFHRYSYFADHHKYKNNYDYNLSIQIMNNRFYMTNGSTLLVENDSFFSPISQLNYSFYLSYDDTIGSLNNSKEIQCIAGIDIPFGMTQKPGLKDYADGVDTMQFLLTL